MSEELKPCPWCGAKAEVWQDNVRTWGLIEHKPDCWLAYDVPRHKQEIPRAEFAAWNRRAGEDAGVVRLHARDDADGAASAAQGRDEVEEEEEEMSKISDELRERGNGYFEQRNGDCEWFNAIADRIDSEMVELPKSADGKIWTGRKVAFWTGAADGDWHEFHGLVYINGKWCVEDNHWQRYPAASVWYERPDSFERIADELEAWCEDTDVDGDACLKLKPRDLVERIRKLVKKEGNHDAD